LCISSYGGANEIPFPPASGPQLIGTRTITTVPLPGADSTTALPPTSAARSLIPISPSYLRLSSFTTASGSNPPVVLNDQHGLPVATFQDDIDTRGGRVAESRRMTFSASTRSRSVSQLRNYSQRRS
jgi:hypothetical protein